MAGWLDKSNPEPIRLYINVKKILGDIIDIEYNYRDLLERTPTDLEALFALVEINLQTENYVGARHFLEKVLEVDPKNSEAKDAIANLPNDQGKK